MAWLQKNNVRAVIQWTFQIGDILSESQRPRLVYGIWENIVKYGLCQSDTDWINSSSTVLSSICFASPSCRSKSFDSSFNPRSTLPQTTRIGKEHINIVVVRQTFPVGWLYHRWPFWISILQWEWYIICDLFDKINLARYY